MLNLEFLPHFRNACLVGGLVPDHFCWNCALRAGYSNCLSFINGTNSLLASVNPITPPSETPTRGSFSMFKMNYKNSRLCIMFKVNTEKPTSFVENISSLLHTIIYSFKLKELCLYFSRKWENVTNVYF